MGMSVNCMSGGKKVSSHLYLPRKALVNLHHKRHQRHEATNKTTAERQVSEMISKKRPRKSIATEAARSRAVEQKEWERWLKEIDKVILTPPFRSLFGVRGER